MAHEIKISKFVRGSHRGFFLQFGARRLFCLGVVHTFDPQHKQFEAIQKLWRQFLKMTTGRKRLVLTEGGRSCFIADPKVAIQENGEGGFVTWLARNAHVPTNSPEPSERLERKRLLKVFSKEDIQLYYFLRYAYQWNCYLDKPNFETYIQAFLSQDRKKSGWKHFDFSFDHMKEVFYLRFGKGFNEGERDFFYSAINPTVKGAIINEIARHSGTVRDNVIAENILRFLRSGKNIFMIYGSGHVSVLRERLSEKLFLVRKTTRP